MRIATTIVAACIAFAGMYRAAVADVGPATVQSAPQIVLPDDGDEYSKLVARAAAQDRSVDFRALRFAWLKSAARKRHKTSEMDMRNAVTTALDAGDFQAARAASVKLLSEMYSSPFGHAFLRGACTRLHDDACAAQEKFVTLGMVKSIMDSGDGKTCSTGWQVASVSEEYFILFAVLGGKPGRQSLVDGPPPCDVLDITDENGKPQTVNFRIDAVREDELSMFKQ
jgi:hypothetical protein